MMKIRGIAWLTKFSCRYRRQATWRQNVRFLDGSPPRFQSILAGVSSNLRWGMVLWICWP